MEKLKVLAVCGFGVGSSMILKMKIEEMLKKNNIDAQVVTADVTSAASTPSNIIFTSKELEKKLAKKVDIPVVGIKNFIDEKEIEEKGLAAIKNM